MKIYEYLVKLLLFINKKFFFECFNLIVLLNGNSFNKSLFEFFKNMN